MKKILSSPVFALVLTIILVIVSLVVNTRVKLGARADAVKELFYETGTEENSIADSLRSLCSASDEIILLGIAYDVDDTEKAKETVDGITEILHSHNDHADRLYELYEDLLKKTFAMESVLARKELSNSDADAYILAQHAAAEAKASIDRANYNDAVRDFQKRYHHFPTPQIAAFSGVDFPKLFA